MFKLRNLISLVFIFVLGVLVYNRFLGTPSEQAQAKTTFQTIGKAFKDVGTAVGGLLKTEKEKFDEGKYSDAMDKIGGFFNKLSDKTKDLGNRAEIENKLTELKERKAEIEQEINAASQKEMTEEESIEKNEELKKNVDDLMKQIINTTREAGVEVGDLK